MTESFSSSVRHTKRPPVTTMIEFCFPFLLFLLFFFFFRAPPKRHHVYLVQNASFVSCEFVPIHPEVLFAHFQEVYFSPSEPLTIQGNFRTHHDAVQNSSSPLEAPFVEAELDLALKVLNLTAATGPDGISPKLNSFLAQNSHIQLILLRLFNACFLKGTTPLSWSESTITVLFKGKGAASDPSIEGSTC